MSQEHRLPQWMAFARNSLGRAFCYRGEPSEGVALQKEGMRSLHGIGSVFQTVLFRLQLAESLFELGELDRAESHLDSAFAHLKAHGEMWLAPEVHRVRLMLLRAQAAPDEVLRHPIGIGLDLARSQGARLLEIRFAACVARLWRDRGEKDRARALLDPVYGWFTEGFDTADLKEPKALLDELR